MATKDIKRKAGEADLSVFEPQLRCSACSRVLGGPSAHLCTASNHRCCATCVAGDEQRCPVAGCPSTVLLEITRPRDPVEQQSVCCHEGCGKSMAHELKANHEASCEKRELTCVVPKCTFRGKASAWLEHLQSAHGATVTHGDSARLICAIAEVHAAAAASASTGPSSAVTGHVWVHILAVHGGHFICVCEFAPRLNAWQMSVASLCSPASAGLKQHRYKVTVGPVAEEGGIEQNGYTWPVASPFAGRTSAHGHYRGVLVANTISLLPYANRATVIPGTPAQITELAPTFKVLPDSREVPAPPAPATVRHPLFAAACASNVVNGRLYPEPPPMAPGPAAQTAALNAFAAAVARRWPATLGASGAAGDAQGSLRTTSAASRGSSSSGPLGLAQRSVAEGPFSWPAGMPQREVATGGVPRSVNLPPPSLAMSMLAGGAGLPPQMAHPPQGPMPYPFGFPPTMPPPLTAQAPQQHPTVPPHFPFGLPPTAAAAAARARREMQQEETGNGNVAADDE